MKEYTIQIEDDIDTKLQYLVGLKVPFSPTTLAGDSVQAILQAIVDDKISQIVIIADSQRDKKLIEAVKSDAKLYADVIAIADAPKPQ